MMARVLLVDSNRPDPVVVAAAAEAIESGGVVLSPTDTVYGLSCDPDRVQAVSRILAIKDRTSDKGFLLLVAGPKWVPLLAEVVPPVFESLQQLWPGPVTFLFGAGGRTPESVVGAVGKVGIRCPDNRLLQAWLRALGRPLLSTSANRSGQPIPPTIPELREMFDRSVDLLLFAEERTSARASTVVDLTVTPPAIRRRGEWADRVEALLNS